MYQTSTPGVTRLTSYLELANLLIANADKIAISIGIIIIAYLLNGVFIGILDRYSRDKKMPAEMLKSIKRLVSYLIAALVVVTVLGIFGIRLDSLILSLGLISLVVALGSQTLISNLLGGTIVFLERSFVIGDLIKVGDNIGEVQNISIRTTTIKGLNGLNIVVPNASFLNSPIINYTRNRSYLIKIPFMMPRGADISGLEGELMERAGEIPGLKPELGINIYKTNINKDNVSYEVHIWITDPRESEKAQTSIINIINGFYPS
ncbi:mechanosensitive ion channel protein MscS [Methanocella sp. CWC-04]|uniref:Mechanosensitive ion channel protein MscS n=1 Tax=Methanooceanicella nereidis TaxID=2052831 RepID=A0AAP2RAR0_9EURY|nr:mechanosensitive ion channel domain-containing protein [Methanocella sp. CWC-04]MCD1293898.1 mechanosensitive ion channel protein MscS [Methanocella sp. CWC-04]